MSFDFFDPQYYKYDHPAKEPVDMDYWTRPITKWVGHFGNWRGKVWARSSEEAANKLGRLFAEDVINGKFKIEIYNTHEEMSYEAMRTMR